MTYHNPVLIKEVVSQLQPHRSGLYVDCTVGGGGRAREILRASGPDGQLIGLDWDQEAIRQAANSWLNSVRVSGWSARVTWS